MRSRPISFAIAAPLVTVAMLATIAAQRPEPVRPEVVEPYHARVNTVVNAIPYVIGYWTGRDQEIPTAAQKLLRPNVILSRSYVEKHPAEWNRRDRAASLLIVQCREARDMLGHFPPICYRSHGMTPTFSQPRDWQVGGLTIRGMEYQFTQRLVGQTFRTTVYNFFVVPDPHAGLPQQCIERDMDAVQKASEDYRDRPYGAAQFQVVFRGPAGADLPRRQRDDVFTTLIEPIVPVIRTIALPSESLASPDGDPPTPDNASGTQAVAPGAVVAHTIGSSARRSHLTIPLSTQSQLQSQPGGLK